MRPFLQFLALFLTFMLAGSPPAFSLRGVGLEESDPAVRQEVVFSLRNANSPVIPYTPGTRRGNLPVLVPQPIRNNPSRFVFILENLRGSGDALSSAGLEQEVQKTRDRFLYYA